MHRYHAFGLGIASDILLPELVAGDPATGIALTIRHADPPDAWETDLTEACACRSMDETRAVFTWKTAGRFLVEHGTTITVWPATGASPESLRLCLLGPVLATALIQRGFLVLHGSAVVALGQGIAFLGGSGKGKSTLAASLGQRGCPLLADDILAVFFDERQRPWAWPGSPHMRLWPDAIAHLGVNAESLPRVHAGGEKRSFRPAQPFSLAAVPLARLYLLSRGSAVNVRLFSPRQAVVAIMRHSFLSQIGLECPLPGDFLNCLRLAHAIPLCKLKRPLSFADSEQVEELIINGMDLPVGSV